MEIVQLLRLRGFPNVLEAPEAERVLAREQIFPGLLVEALRVSAVHVGDVYGKGTVDINGYGGDTLLIGELVEQQNQLLRAPHRKCRHDDATAAPCGTVDYIRQFVDNVVRTFVKAPAVGALEDQVFDRLGPVRIADDGKMWAAQVAGKGQADPLLAGRILQPNRRRPQDVAGIVALVGETRSETARLVIVHWPKQRQRALYVFH